MTTPTPAAASAAVAPQGGQSAALPSGLSVQQVLEQMAAMQSQLDRLMGNQPVVEGPREKKTYYHQVPGSSICVTRKGPRGEQLPTTYYFYGGELTTDIPEVQDFLEAIVDVGGSPVTSRAPGSPDSSLSTAAQEVVNIAAATIDKLGAEAGPKR